ncbi:MAG: magnesium transporter, partial [Oceanococcaceae bacterium]
LVGAIVSFWFSSPKLGLVIALAMLINQIGAAFAGVGLPLLLQKLNVDPALAGSVVLTTVTDVVGFFAFLGLRFLRSAVPELAALATVCKHPLRGRLRRPCGSCRDCWRAGAHRQSEATDSLERCRKD